MLFRVLWFLGMAVLTAASFAVPDAPAFQQPALARLIFFHLPCAFLATGYLLYGSYLSFVHLKKQEATTDIRAESANEIGMLFAILTMVTGVLFSKVQWGAWWQWDPRQTSFLMVLLLYSAYFALRGALADPVRRASNSAAYSVAMLLPTLFLVFVFPRLPQVASFHPSNTIVQGGFDANYRMVIVGLFLSMLVAAVWLYRLRVRAGMFELNVELSDGKLDDRSDRTPTGVVRPVSVPAED